VVVTARMKAQPAEDFRWRLLVAAVERLAVAEDLPAVIEIVRTSARAISGADGVSFVLRDGDACRFVEEDAIAPLWKGQRLALTRCISGWCMLNNCTTIISDIYADSRVPHDIYRPTFVKSLIVVPVRAGTTVAAIGFYWSEPREFSADAHALVEALARSVSIAIAASQTRASLHENEERLSLALAAGDLFAWSIELSTGRLAVSRDGEAAFGLAPGGSHTHAELIEALYPLDRARYLKSFETAVREGSPLSLDLRANGPAGTTRWLEIRGRADHGRDGASRYLAGVCRDITARKTADVRLAQLQSEMAQFGRLNEMGEMAGTLSHELNQPLAAAHNYLAAARRLLKTADFEDTRIAQAISGAEAAFVRASQIVKRIQTFLQKAESVKMPEPLGTVLREACELARVEARHRGVDVKLEIGSNLPHALIDRVQIQQVLLNLLRNAFEAMDGQERERRVRVSARLSDGGVHIDVSDNGPGLSEEVARDLFKPFTTTKKSGMGLGLSLSRSIIEAHEGKMWASSRAGDGTTFHFTLPAAEARQPERAVG
jgi:signal transduction histidine kinase